jgi:hypothetical protein
MAKSELQERLWPDTFVVEANLANLVAELRDGMGEKGHRDGFVRTVHGFGYAFSGEAVDEPAPGAAGPALAAVAFVRDGRAILLGPGETVIGRGPDAAVLVDDTTVSRRHARVTVHGGEVVLEDLGSKNGTSVNGKALDRKRVLRHGDAVLLGSVLFTVRSAASETATMRDAPTSVS